MKIYPVPALEDNYIWTLINDDENTAVIVDPGDAAPILSFLEKENLNLRAILITHHHWDHTDGIGAVLNRFQVPVYASADEKIAHCTHALRENDIVDIPGFPALHVLSIPGHTAGHIAYYGDDALICGDTLFATGCGRIFEGTPEQMYRSLQKLAALPEHTLVYPAHEYTLNNLRFAATVETDNPKIDERVQVVKKLIEKNNCSLPSTMKNEKETNPFLRCNIPSVIAQTEKQVNKTLSNEVEVFTELRKWKDNFR